MESVAEIMSSENNNVLKALEDRISNLPEDLITHILSSLPTNDAVRTSLLSNQWKYKYIRMYNIHIDFKPLNDQVRISSRDRCMNKLLTHEGSTIKSFSLVLRDRTLIPLSRCLRKWITQVLSRTNVQNLVIEAAGINNTNLPRCLLAGPLSLTTLSLSLSCSIEFPAVDCFPYVKNLYLEGCKFGALRRLDKHPLVLNFPALEILEMTLCSFFKVKFVEINVPRLVTFKFIYTDSGVKFYAPRLAELYYYGRTLSDFALFAPKLHYMSLDPGPFSHEPGASITLLKGTPSLKYLNLSQTGAEALAQYEGVHAIPSLEWLHVCCHPEELLKLLKMMPGLESLKLDMPNWNQYKHNKQLPPCIAPTLKEVEFIDFIGENNQINLAKMLLQNVRSLESVTVCLGKTPHTREDVIARLSTFLPMSSSCTISVR